MLRRACSAAALALTVATGVNAESFRVEIPTDPDVTFPCQINLVGTRDGVADPVGEFAIVVRDIAGNPIAGETVRLSFENCSDLRIGAVQPFPGLEVTCTDVGAIVDGVTDAAGTVHFRIVGGARNYRFGSPATGFRCGRVYVGSYLAGRFNVGAFDQNSAGGVNPADISVWLSDSFDPDFEGRSDFNCSNSINPTDLSILLSVTLAFGSTTSSALYCN